MHTWLEKHSQPLNQSPETKPQHGEGYWNRIPLLVVELLTVLAAEGMKVFSKSVTPGTLTSGRPHTQEYLGSTNMGWKKKEKKRVQRWIGREMDLGRVKEGSMNTIKIDFI